MKKCLFAIVLLYTGQYAYADATFKFNSLIPKNNQQSLAYYIKGKQLKYTDSSSTNNLIYNQKLQQLTTIDSQSGAISTINEKRLKQQVAQLNQQRLARLRGVEEKINEELANKTSLEKQTGATLIAQLKYPEQYGEHTLLTIKPLDKTKTVNNIECQSYQLFKKARLLKEFCLASREAIGINKLEYTTLRGFYTFGYNMQSKIMIAMGNTRFEIVDYDQHKMPGVVIETISYIDNKIAHHQVLASVNKSPLSSSIFELETANKK